MKGFSVFGRRLLALTRGETAPVQVLSDGRNSSIAGIATGYVSSVVAQWNLTRAGGHSALMV